MKSSNVLLTLLAIGLLFITLQSALAHEPLNPRPATRTWIDDWTEITILNGDRTKTFNATIVVKQIVHDGNNGVHDRWANKAFYKQFNQLAPTGTGTMTLPNHVIQYNEGECFQDTPFEFRAKVIYKEDRQNARQVSTPWIRVAVNPGPVNGQAGNLGLTFQKELSDTNRACNNANPFGTGVAIVNRTDAVRVDNPGRQIPVMLGTDRVMASYLPIPSGELLAASFDQESRKLELDMMPASHETILMISLPNTISEELMENEGGLAVTGNGIEIDYDVQKDEEIMRQEITLNVPASVQKITIQSEPIMQPPPKSDTKTTDPALLIVAVTAIIIIAISIGIGMWTRKRHI